MTSFVGGVEAEAVAGTAAFWLAALVLGLTALAASSVRIVPSGGRAVVSTRGRVRRVAGPGLAFRLPGLERLTMMSVDPVHMPLVVTAVTGDGVRVRILASAASQVTDPVAAAAVPDPLSAAANAAEDALGVEVSRRSLSDLLPARERLEARLPGQVTARTSAWGVNVDEIELTDMETRLTPGLLRAVHRS